MTGIFESILNWIYSLIGNYGLSVIFFTLLVRLLLLPLDIKSRKSMRAMTKVQPKLQALQKKYANDRDKLNQKTMELYKKEKVSPAAGCLPMILQMVVLFIMFAAMRNIAAEKTGEMLYGLMNRLAESGTWEGIGRIPTESFLWVKNIFQPDSFGAPVLPTFSEAVSYIKSAGFSLPDLENLETLYNAYRGNVFGTGQFYTMRILFFNLTYPNSFDSLINYANGLFILPIFAAVSQLIMTKVTSAQQKSASGEVQQQANAMNSGFMKWFFPLFSLYICAGYNAAFAVYWAAANIIAIVQQIVLNLYFDHKDKLAAEAEQSVSDDI